MKVSRRNTIPFLRPTFCRCRPALTALAVATSLAFLAAPVFAQGQGQGKGQGQVAPSEGEWVPGRLLVQPRPGLSDAEFDKVLKPVGGQSVGRIEGINVHIVDLPPQASERAVAALLRNNKHLKFAERDMIVKIDSTADDPYFGSAWHLFKINAPTAWVTSMGDGVAIAILDTGVDANHPDLVAQMLPGWNFVENNANTSDVHGHGTRVAGTAAASTNNALGVASVAGGARIVPVRIADANGYASYSTIAKGLTWAADQGAQVANISIGGVAGSSSIRSAAQYMKNRGGVVVAGAGNSGGEESIAPTDTIISVSATTSSDVRASWSSYGAYIDVAAPGAKIWTTSRGGGYNSVSGTSFSGPVVAGVVAKMMAANPTLAPDDIQFLLYATAVDLGTSGWDKIYGHGRIDAAAAVQAASGVKAAATDTTPPSVSVSNPANGETVKGLVAVNVAATDNVGVTRVDLTVNGKLFASDTTAPYGFSWDSTKVGDGNVKLAAYAFDAAGNSTSHAVTVAVENTVASEPAPVPANDTIAPTVTIGSPSNGSTVNGNVNVDASATDNVGVTRMRLYINGSLVSTGNGDSVSHKWAARNAASGNHTFRVEAEDAAGNIGTKSVTVFKR